MCSPEGAAVHGYVYGSTLLTSVIFGMGERQKFERRVAPTNPFRRTALVLQGGGALGAYQAGVYEVLSEAGYEPHWIAGISTGRDKVCVPPTRIWRVRPGTSILI
jgi:hypothetical protein